MRLDFAEATHEKQCEVSLVATNSYAEWRVRPHGAPAFCETPESPPPERLLQAIWYHQCLRRDQLRLLDGRAVRVLHPGFWNREAGPDFRRAIVQIEAEAARSGDVEVDVHTSGWLGHHHDRNPNFKNVILHVVWVCDRNTDAPTLVIKDFVNAPLSELEHWLSHDAQSFPEALKGRCSAPLHGLSPAQWTELLHQAALVRLQRKATDLQARARQAGWEQALWEGMLRALGYKHNLWPMQCLAELRPRLASGENLSVFQLQARLLAVGGLLPPDLTRNKASTDKYLRRVWDYWWRERDQLEDCALPRELWHFAGLRPANHPQRRLALVAHWWLDPKLLGRLQTWFAGENSERNPRETLLAVLHVAADEFWSRHWTLRSASLPKARPLLGAPRVTDLAVNVILPWFWIRAVEGKNERLQRAAEDRYFAWPSGEDNAVLRLARHRLFGGAVPRSFKGAACQQGLLQVVRDYCERSNALCDHCDFPKLVRDWARRH
ncbi:MAG: hypothetical protein DME26_02925 [Verrucomicrobia bacterium]|nr:MAG: hypothetical protein DME26_02925 [Verrucomicrobiota bacterium]